jgi:streptogramin lyase
VLAVALRDEPQTSTAPSEPAPLPAPEVDSIKLGGRPNIVLGGGGHVWTGRFLSRNLDTIDPATMERAAEPRPEIGIGLTGLAVHGRSLWAVASRERRLLHLDVRTGRRLGEPIVLPGAANAVAASEDAVYVAVTQPELDPRDQILVIDPRTGETRRTLEVREGIRRLLLARGRLWLLASDPAEVIGIDVRDTSARLHVPLGAGSSTDLAAGAGFLWVTLYGNDTLSRIRFKGGRPAEFPTGRGPAGIVVRHGTVWVANRTDSTLSRIDVRTGRPAKRTIEVPLNPYDLAAYRDAIWVTSLTTGRIARVTGLGG